VTEADRLHPEFADLWPGSLPRLEASLAAVARAVEALEGGGLDGALRAEAERGAHKLVGTLGTYGLLASAATARELENAFADGGGPVAADLPALRERCAALERGMRGAGE
jgi:HPt (histidine-containing phosphotransfer) domain-containing protein